MSRYVIKRILLAILTVFIVVTITFFAMNSIPGGPFQREKALTPAVEAALMARYHLDQPVINQFGYYLQNIFKGDFGVSIKTGREISTIIGDSFGYSARLGIQAALLALAGGLTLGMVSALNRNKLPDRIIIFFTNLFVSVPSFILATILLLVFALQLGWFPVWSPTDPSYVLPIIALSMYPMAYITRLTKTSLLDVLGQDYIRTARSKGVSRFGTITRHALKNAVLPVITYFGPMLAGIITGSMVVETVFTIPGLGSEFVKSIHNSDYPLIMGTTIFLATLMVTFNLISDLLYKVVDPRIELG